KRGKQRRWRKRRRYTASKRKEILEAVNAAGVAEAARRFGVPQTTISNWLHRDAAKLAKEQAAQPAADRGSRLEAARKRGGATPKAVTEPAGPNAAAEPNVESGKRGTTAPKGLRKRVARSYT